MPSEGSLSLRGRIPFFWADGGPAVRLRKSAGDRCQRDGDRFRVIPVTITPDYLGTLTLRAKLLRLSIKRGLIAALRQPWRPRLAEKMVDDR